MKRLSIVLIGIISGVFLGVFFWIVQSMNAIKVYALLMNVDYIPLLKDWNMHYLTEFMLHLIVSVITVCVLYAIFKRWSIQHYLLPYVLACGVIGILLYGTTAFSSHTPALLDLSAIFYWEIGHLLYGLIVGFFLQKLGRTSS